MAMDPDRLRCTRAETLVLLTRDEEQRLKGVLHFVPCYGRATVSLSFMRRDPDTPNGLTEFLVCGAVELLRDRELKEMSLNFATFARYMHSPRDAARAAARLDRQEVQPVLPDREPVPLQREVLPALGGALPRLRGGSGAAARRSRRGVGGGSGLEAGAPGAPTPAAAGGFTGDVDEWPTHLRPRRRRCGLSADRDQHRLRRDRARSGRSSARSRRCSSPGS